MGSTKIVLIDRSPQYLRAVQERFGGVVDHITHAIQEGAVIAIQTSPASGVTYEKEGRVHQASAPGEAPATDLSVLEDSIEANVEKAYTDLEGVVEVGAGHGAPLEEGTEDGRIAPRPFLRPAAEVQEQPFETAVASAVRNAGNTLPK